MKQKINSINGLFLPLSQRIGSEPYFFRICSYSEHLYELIVRYIEAARICGAVLESDIDTPPAEQCEMFNKTLGTEVRFNKEFIQSALSIWLKRATDAQKTTIADIICRELDPNDFETYRALMCLLYYKLEWLVDRFYGDQPPKILCEGNISAKGAILLHTLKKLGCDVILLNYSGNEAYMLADPKSLSEEILLPNSTPFPEGFSLTAISDKIEEKLIIEHMYGIRPSHEPATNTWISGKYVEDLLKAPNLRGTDSTYFYNCLFRIRGTDDTLTYQTELFNLYSSLKNSGRNVVTVSNTIPIPTVEEISKLRRRMYTSLNMLITELASNISFPESVQLQRTANKAFVDTLMLESKKESATLNSLTNTAVHILCWLKRYQTRLFSSVKYPDTACFIYLGGCKNENEAAFCKFLSFMPTDVVIFVPDINKQCLFKDQRLYEINYPLSVHIDKFPEQNSDIRIGTYAYNAEKEVSGILYDGTGLYKTKQHSAASTVTLQTIYEEIPLLWQQNIQYRPGFVTTGDMVSMPVIFAQISGVKDRNTNAYWYMIKELVAKDCLYIASVPHITSFTNNPMKQFATDFVKDGKLQLDRILSHPNYPYSILREPIQEHILDKIELMLSSKMIKGTFENGTEYLVVSVCLNLEQSIIRRIQNLDFTQNNPKLVYSVTKETPLSVEDAIFTVFLHLIGFDVLLFAPTGYKLINGYLNTPIEEHQAGDYMYDLVTPDLATVKPDKQSGWKNIFKWH